MMHPREEIVVGPLAIKMGKLEEVYVEASRRKVTAGERQYWRTWFSLVLRWREEQRQFWEDN